MKFSIIIPILNEEKNIYRLAKLIKKNIKKVMYEIIFIDDNSNDNSKFILKKIQNKNISFIIRKKKRDLTQSCIDGIKKSKNENIVIMDGDLQHHPKCLAKMLRFYIKKKPSLLIGTRKFSKNDGLSFLRRVASVSLIFLINTILKKKTKDPMSGFFIIKKKIFYKVKKKLYGKGFKILFDILYSLDSSTKILDYNIKFRKRKLEYSKMNSLVLYHIISMIFIKFLKNKKLTFI
jgi:dolichol-phosphate mannosyltransferase